MSEENFNYITIPNIRERTTSTFYGKANNYGEENSESTYFEGEMFFDSELIKNEKIKTNYRDGLLVGNVEIQIRRDREESYGYDSIINISETHLIYEHHIQNVNMIIECSSEAYECLKQASKNGNEVRVKFEVNEWEKRDSSYDYANYSTKCKVFKIEISSNKQSINWFKDRRIRHIENYLFTNLCGGWTEGQIPNICKEFAQAFADKAVFDNRKELLENIFEFIRSIKWTLEIKKSKLREEIEEGDDLDLFKLFSLNGNEFDVQFAKVAEKDKSKILVEYNTIWERVDAEKMFKDGYAWNNEEFPSLADEYLKIQYVNSPTLNKILVDGLIKKDIANNADEMQYVTGQISSEAIFSITNGVYDVAKIKAKNKNIKELFFIFVTESIFGSIGLGVRGLFVWWITSLIAGNFEIGHYILFGTIFGADMIVTTLKLKTSDIANEENHVREREKNSFYILRDMCALHKQSEYMDANLLRHLMYKIEERGVQMNNYIYKILNRVV